MTDAELFGLPVSLVLGQVVVGLVNGSFYAMLSLGLAVIFGMLNIVNFAHGTFYMMGAVLAWMLFARLGLGYWYSLVLIPVVIGALGAVLERTLLRRLYAVDHVFPLLFTLGLAYIVEGAARSLFAAQAMSYAAPAELLGPVDLGIMLLPRYRLWVICFSLAVCLGTWLLIERTKLGSYLRAATENPGIARSLGINVSLLVTLTYGAGIGLAAMAGVLAAPVYQINPFMGHSLLITAFAVVVIGGMGSIGGAIFTGMLLGLIEGMTRAYWPQGSSVVIFLVMILTLVLRPTGLFGKE